MSATAFQRLRREQAAREAVEQGIQLDAELEQLRERAKELGIANADRKGEKRLREEIAEAEAATVDSSEEPGTTEQVDADEGDDDGDA